MKMIALVALWILGLSASSLAQDINCGAKGPDPKPSEIKLISWNIAELATAVRVYDRLLRSEDEFKDLRLYRECSDGHVYAMQEIASLRALARVFPPSQYILCISGQTVADQRGLAPDYPFNQLSDIKPQCVTDPTSAVSTLPGELTNPARQYVALAIKRSSGVSLGDTRDVVDLGPKDPATDHQTRWGLDITLNKNGALLRLLVVHMKSRCNEDPIEEPSDNDHCPALFRQLQPLKSWIRAAHQGGGPVIVAGDFNRRFDRESPEIKTTDMWDVMSGASTSSPDDDVKLTHIPKNKEFKCWPTEPASQRFSIDFFVLNEKAAALADAGSYWKWRYAKTLKRKRRVPVGPVIIARFN